MLVTCEGLLVVSNSIISCDAVLRNTSATYHLLFPGDKMANQIWKRPIKFNLARTFDQSMTNSYFWHWDLKVFYHLNSLCCG